MNAFVSVAELARALHPQGSKHRVMALLRAYFDMSQTQPVGIMAIGGYVGSEAAWIEVERQWRANLDLWGLDEFHLSVIQAGKSVVGYSDADACVRSFSRIMGKSELESIGAAFREDDWNQVIKSPEDLARFPKPYYFCLDLLFHILSQHMTLQFADDSVAAVFDSDVKPDDAIQAIVDRWKAADRQQLATVTFADKIKFPMLQCADLYAGVERKSWLGRDWGDMPNPQPNFVGATGTRGRGVFWSIKTQERIKEVLERYSRGEIPELGSTSARPLAKRQP